jgi:predicted alpha/beta superfamily hydrolase
MQNKNKLFFGVAVFLLLIACNKTVESTVNSNDSGKADLSIKYYSKVVKDTFVVSVSLPDGYQKSKKRTYPVVYILDANLYFDIMATTCHKYADIGLIPPVILVGIGYKDLQTMDSLRCRDFTFPTALAEYEMSVSGKAPQFLNFLTKELIPYFDANYSVNKKNRMLMGHSLGGYFTLYALQQQLIKKSDLFGSYVAASPSTHYNRNYLVQALQKLPLNNKHKIKSYITFGGLEDEEDGDASLLKADETLKALGVAFNEKSNIVFKGDIYSNLGHMDTPLPTFIKGLQFALNK